MAGFFDVTNKSTSAVLTVGQLVFAPRETRTVYLTDADEEALDEADIIKEHNTTAANAVGTDGKVVVRDLDPNDNAHDHAIAEDVASGLAAAATLQEAFVALSARVKALEDAAP